MGKNTWGLRTALSWFQRDDCSQQNLFHPVPLCSHHKISKMLKECKNAKSWDIDEDLYLDFNDLIHSVALLAAVSNPKDGADKATTEPATERNHSKKEKAEKEQVDKTLVKNDNPHPDRLLENHKDWKKDFVGKTYCILP